jgi:glycosyltransferase involved in cell wall biosynthesis
MASRLKTMVRRSLWAKIVSLPNPIPSERIQCESLSELPSPLSDDLGKQRNIVFCGRLIEVKRPDLALRSFAAAISKTGSNAKLIILGDGPLRSELEELAKFLTIDDRVVWMGQVSNPFSIMSRCEIGLLTSVKEGFPNVLLEMMASGLKSIVTTPCADDLTSLNGVVVTSAISAEELTKELERALTSPSDHQSEFEYALKKRSPDIFLDKIL